jgi:hypothetical protein
MANYEDSSISTHISDLIHVLEAIDEEEDIVRPSEQQTSEGGKEEQDVEIDDQEEDDEKKEFFEETTTRRKLPNWMRDPRVVATEQTQRALDMQAKKV